MVTEQPDGSGLVTADAVQVRVGSQLNQAHHVFQVTLKKGDRVDILDRVYLQDPKVPEWFKIHSPDEEVRYVAASQLSIPGTPSVSYGALTPPAQGTSVPAAPLMPYQPQGTGTMTVVTNRIIPPAQPIGGSSGTSAPPVGSPAAPSVSGGAGSSSSDTTGGKVPLLNTSSSITGVSSEATPVSLATAIQDNATLPVTERLRAFENQLQLMKTREPRSWDLQGAKQTAEKLLTEATTPEQRQQATTLLSDVQRLEELEQQFDRVLRQRELTLQKDAELEAMQRRLQNQAQRALPRFTAEGKLDQGTLVIDGQQSYILKNSEGFTTHYVVPDGIKIDSYVGRNVGLFGKVSTTDGLPSPVLRLEQLTPLDG
jgi:hypothetical protein